MSQYQSSSETINDINGWVGEVEEIQSSQCNVENDISNAQQVHLKRQMWYKMDMWYEMWYKMDIRYVQLFAKSINEIEIL
jgi:hypothetical protein